MRYQVQLAVPRIGGTLAWGTAAGDFERRLAGQESATVIAPRLDRVTRRGRDFVRLVIVMTIEAGDVAEALDLAWWVFRKAAGDDVGGWDTAAAGAEVRPEGRLPAGVMQYGADMRKAGQLVTGFARVRPYLGKSSDGWPDACFGGRPAAARRAGRR